MCQIFFLDYVNIILSDIVPHLEIYVSPRSSHGEMTHMFPNKFFPVKNRDLREKQAIVCCQYIHLFSHFFILQYEESQKIKGFGNKKSHDLST